MENPGVCYLTVNLHHHLKLLVLDDAVWIDKKTRTKLSAHNSGYTRNINLLVWLYIKTNDLMKLKTAF